MIVGSFLRHNRRAWSTQRAGVAQIVDDHFGRTKNLLPAAVTPLEDFEHDVVGPRRNGAGADSLVAERIKRLAEALFGFDAVLAQELVELLERHLHALAEVFGRD